MNEIILELKNITKKYPGVIALSNISFELKRGEIHSIVGENGAGKTTLMKVITGAERKDGGEIKIDNKSVHDINPIIAKSLGIFAIQQHFSLIPFSSVAENIFFGNYPKNSLGLIDWKKLNEEAQVFLAQLGFEDIDVTAPIVSLSVAEQQKVEIAKAIIQKPQILIMDEPSAVLPTDDLHKLYKIIRHLKENKVGIIYISHHLDEIFDLSDRITVLKDGKKVITIDSKDTNKNGLIRFMVGREISELYPKEHYPIGETVLEVNDLSNNILKSITFNLRRGEILGIAGLVGSGRTELCETLFGLRPWKKGEVILRGKKIHIRNPQEAIQKGIGFITEDRHATGLILTMSVCNNMTFVGFRKVSNNGFFNKKFEKKIASEFAKKMNIVTPSLQQIVQYLSGGNQQKVVLAKWLIQEPRILLMDEPTRGIDVSAKVEIYRLMNRLVKEGTSIIMVSSELPEILGMSDRILVMRKGSIVGEYNCSETCEEEVISCASGLSYLRLE